LALCGRSGGGAIDRRRSSRLVRAAGAVLARLFVRGKQSSTRRRGDAEKNAEKKFEKKDRCVGRRCPPLPELRTAWDAAFGGAAGRFLRVRTPGNRILPILSSSPRFSPRLRASASKWSLTHSHETRGSEYSGLPKRGATSCTSWKRWYGRWSR
jgi:hypothetical protein